MKTILVNLGERSYPIYIGDGIINKRELLQRHMTGKQVMLVSNETVAPMYLDAVARHCSEYIVKQIILPDGEKYKSLKYFDRIITILLENHFSRNCCLVAIGGGVIGDLTGFAAACYQRGVPFIQVPTTLLAQVDSSVGGKTAVNHTLGKNMIGAFHQPAAVLADTAVLGSLSDREFSAGMAEIIKYGLIRDADFFDWLEENIDMLLKRQPDALAYAIERSCINKAQVVEEDERESGIRAILNLGHTFGHAIETALKYKDWLHGEAVACGMLMAADLSQSMGWLDQDEASRIRSVLVKANLPVILPKSIHTKQMLELMRVDKKARDGEIFLVLLQGIGKAVVTIGYEQAKLTETIEKYSAN